MVASRCESRGDYVVKGVQLKTLLRSVRFALDDNANNGGLNGLMLPISRVARCAVVAVERGPEGESLVKSSFVLVRVNVKIQVQVQVQALVRRGGVGWSRWDQWSTVVFVARGIRFENLFEQCVVLFLGRWWRMGRPAVVHGKPFLMCGGQESWHDQIRYTDIDGKGERRCVCSLRTKKYVNKICSWDEGKGLRGMNDTQEPPSKDAVSSWQVRLSDESVSRPCLGAMHGRLLASVPAGIAAVFESCPISTLTKGREDGVGECRGR
jgi:hypothetical protein